MKLEATAMPAASDVDVNHRWRPDIVRCGAELVGLSERFYGGIFVGGIIFVGMAALAALLLLPLRGGGLPGGHVTPALAVTGLIMAVTPLAARHAGALYRLLRRRPSIQVGLVAVAALLVVPPLRSQLWWPSCTILMLLAVVTTLRRALAYCFVVLAANMAGHVVAGDVSDQAGGIIGLWIGYPFWTAIVSIITDRLAGHILRLNAGGVPPHPTPRRVSTWEDECPAEPSADVEAAGRVTSDSAVLPRSLTTGDSTPTPGDRQAASTLDSVAGIERLTARQLQVVALLADGLRYREVAACLSISMRQVQRHVAQAVARLGVRNAYELLAVATGQGMVPSQRAPDPVH